MKDFDEIKVYRVTTNLTLEVGDQFKAVAKKIGIPMSVLVRLVLENEIEHLATVTHVTEIRRGA